MTNHECWYALTVLGRREVAVATALERKNVRSLVPLHETFRQWSDRIKRVQLPLFPGYVFGQFNQEDRLRVVTTPGVLDIVRVGTELARIDPAEIEAIQNIVASNVVRAPHSYVNAGDRVTLWRGPLAGLQGIILSEGRGYKLVVSVTLLQRSLAVEVDPAWIMPCLNFDGCAGSSAAHSARP